MLGDGDGGLITDSSPRGFHSTLSQNQAPRRFALCGHPKLNSVSLRRMGNFIFSPVLALSRVAVPPMSIPLVRPSEYSPGARPTQLTLQWSAGLLRAPYIMETTAFKSHGLTVLAPLLTLPMAETKPGMNNSKDFRPPNYTTANPWAQDYLRIK